MNCWVWPLKATWLVGLGALVMLTTRELGWDQNAQFGAAVMCCTLVGPFMVRWRR